MKPYRVTFHLASGASIVTEVEYDESFDDEEVAADVAKTLAGPPHWLTFENVIAYSQTVSAVEIEEIGIQPEVTHR